MKKVLLVITKSAWGGAQRYVYDLVTRLPREKFEIAVACGGDGLLTEKVRKAGIRVIQLPDLGRDIHIGREFKSLWLLIRICLRERPDIVHLNSSKAGGLGAVAAFICKFLPPIRYLPRNNRGSGLFRGTLAPRIIFAVHGWGFEEDRPRWQKAFIIFLSWLGALFQDKIILINDADRRLARRFIPERKLALIRHGIAPIEFLARGEARAFFAEKIGREIGPDDILIGTVAEMTRNKGLNYLIDSTSQIKFKIQNSKFKILIVGVGEDKEKLQKQINSLGLHDTIHLAGFIPDASRYLTGFDIFVLPSLKEGLPYVLMEAMAAGLPAAASSVGGIPDLVTNEKNGLLVPPKNPSALAEAIAFLAKNSPAAQILGREAQKTVTRRFTVDAMIKDTMRLYTAVTS